MVLLYISRLLSDTSITYGRLLIYNLYDSHGLSKLKLAYITPILGKMDLDPAGRICLSQISALYPRFWLYGVMTEQQQQQNHCHSFTRFGPRTDIRRCWLIQLVKRHQLQPHAYDDDTHTYGHCNPSVIDVLRARVTGCSDPISAWTMANSQQFTPSKTKVLFVFLTSTWRPHQLPTTPSQLGSVLQCRLCVTLTFT